MIVALVAAALARDVDVKVHDMQGAVSGPVVVELAGPGGTVALEPRDDGAAPDAMAGDHLYTARAEGLALENGNVSVRAGGRTWQGGFQFDAQSDPVLLIGLEPSGFAAASTREIVFTPDQPAQGRGPAAPDAAAPPPAPKARTGVPTGTWTGWGIGAVCLAGLGALAWVGARRPPRLPPLVGPARETTRARGPWTAGPTPDLFVGPLPGGAPPDALAVGPGRWSPEEIAIAALRVRGPVRVVVTDASRVEAVGDPEAALGAALAGVADLLWAA